MGQPKKKDSGKIRHMRMGGNCPDSLFGPPDSPKSPLESKRKVKFRMK